MASGLEVLGAVAAASQLVEQVVKIVTLVNDIRDAPKDVLEHIESLSRLTAVAEGIKLNPSYQSTQTAEILASINIKTTDLVAILNKANVSPADNKSNAIRKAVFATWKDERIITALDQIERDKNTLALWLARIDAHNLSDKIKLLTSEVNNLRQAQDASSFNEEQWRDYCLAELFITNPSDDRAALTRTKGARATGSCTWITENQKFLSWREPHSQLQLLWVRGGPGKGKTMISIYVTEELEKAAVVESVRLHQVIYFFCDNKDSSRNSATAILRGLILQMILIDPDLTAHILPDFKLQRGRIFEMGSFESLWRVFQSIVSHTKARHVYCFLDAIDELRDESLTLLLQKLRNLSEAKLKIIVFSRHFPHQIKEALHRYPTISLDPDSDEEINRDVQNYIAQVVDELSLMKQYSPDLKKHILEVLRTRSEGTFLWVGFAVNILKHVTISDTESCLNGLPAGLDAIYARILRGIQRQNASLVASMLTWATLAVRPLTLRELATAVSLQPTARLTLLEVARDKIQLCGGLLLSDNDRVVLVHQSAKDYLLRPGSDPDPRLGLLRVDVDEGNCDIARKCLELLASANPSETDIGHAFWFGNRAESLNVSEMPLISYAITNWIDHARASPSFARRCSGLFGQFFGGPTSTGNKWLTFYLEEEEEEEEEWSLHDALVKISNSRGAHSVFAAILGLSQLVLELWPRRRKRDKFARSPQYVSLALLAASWSGAEEVVRFLLRQGAKVDVRDSETQYSPLYVAARRGQEAIVKMLLEAGAKVDSETQYSPLYVAAKRGQEAIVKMLLEAGAKADSKNRGGDSPLSIAVKEQAAPTVISRLIQAGASVSNWDISGQTLLHHASGRCDEVRMALLLKAGADVNAVNFRGRTPLHEWGQWGVLLGTHTPADVGAPNLLLASGANIHAVGRNGRTPLHIAAAYGLQIPAEHLLDHGANVNATDRRGKTPLHLATQPPRKAVVKVLIQRGANVDAIDEMGKTPLHGVERFETSGAMVQVLDMFFQAGASLDHKDREGNTPLHLSARWGKPIMIQWLLQRHVDPLGGNAEAQTPREVAEQALSEMTGELERRKKGVFSTKNPKYNNQGLKYDNQGIWELEDAIDSLPAAIEILKEAEGRPLPTLMTQDVT